MASFLTDHWETQSQALNIYEGLVSYAMTHNHAMIQTHENALDKARCSGCGALIMRIGRTVRSDQRIHTQCTPPPLHPM